MIDEDLLQRLQDMNIPEFFPRSGPTGTEYGSSSFCLLTGDVLVIHRSFPEHTIIAEHDHPQLVICFIRKGSALQCIGDNEYRAAAGDTAVILPGQKHSLAVGTEPLDITEIVLAV